jgi:hypothetical protein
VLTVGGSSNAAIDTIDNVNNGPRTLKPAKASSQSRGTRRINPCILENNNRELAQHILLRTVFVNFVFWVNCD